MPSYSSVIKDIIRGSVKKVVKAAPKILEERVGEVRPLLRPKAEPIMPRPAIAPKAPAPPAFTRDPADQATMVHRFMEISGDLAKAEREGLSEVDGIPVQILQATKGRLQKTVDGDAEMQAALKKIHEQLGVASPEVSGPTPAVNPEAGGTELVEKLRKSILEAEPIRKEQQKLHSASRSETAARAEAELQGGGGEAAYHRALQTMKTGPLPKAQFKGARDQFTDAEVEALFDMVNTAPKLRPFQKIHANAGLTKLLGLHGAGAVPQRGELQHLVTVFGRDLVDAALSKRSATAKKLSFISELFSVPKSIRASLDMSGAGRQGVMFITRPEYWKAINPMVKAWRNEQWYNGIMQDITDRPSHKLMQDWGLALTGIDDFMPHEESFVSKWAGMYPGVEQSQRSYTAFLNKLRADVFDTKLNAAIKAGVDIDDPKFQKSLVTWINSASGRGNLGKLEGAAEGLNQAFFSPRLVKARIDTLNPLFYAQMHPWVRRQAIMNTVRTATAIISALALVSQVPGVSVSLDPKSADFGKIRRGNTRIDIMGGHQQIIRVTAQLITGEAVSTTTGRRSKLGEKYGAPTRRTVAERFVYSKASPAVALVLAMWEGKDYKGDPIKVDQEALKLLYPIIIEDVLEVMDQGDLEGLWALPFAFAGLGVNTYGPRKKDKREYTGSSTPRGGQ